MAQELWDREAETFDQAADHGLPDPECRAGVARPAGGALPPAPARVADLGCGTGTLSLLLAEEGHAVTGSTSPPRWSTGPATRPATSPPSSRATRPSRRWSRRRTTWCSAATCSGRSRHRPRLERWIGLLAPGGRLVLVEGRWHTGAGLTAVEAERIVRTRREHVEVRHLPEAVDRGKEIHDERYAPGEPARRGPRCDAQARWSRSCDDTI